MTTKKANTSTCIIKKSASRSQVWEKFLEERLRGNKPVLMDSSDGFSYVCIPADEPARCDEDLRFLETVHVHSFASGKKKGHGVVELDGPKFVGGWVGFFTYDFCAELCGVSLRQNLRIPKMVFVWCDKVYAFEVTKEDGLKSLKSGDFYVRNFKSGITKKEYANAFKKIQKFLSDGESYQVNFAQEFIGDFDGDPFALYQALYAMNPSQMCFFMEGEWGAVCSNSPERLFSLQNGVLRTEPIKGTVPASDDPKFLLRDKKSYAELTMIVDLMRNDLARVSKIGSVKVLKHQLLMRLKNVWHSYSVIESQLESGKTIRDVFMALLPGGSVTGCPKKRTIGIIDRLENFSRGAYCGSAGYVSTNGNADFNIMIRTATVRGGGVSFPSGGGIVADSTCEGEYEETIQKSKIMQNATRSL